jgi:hypothetical protein
MIERAIFVPEALDVLASFLNNPWLLSEMIKYVRERGRGGIAGGVSIRSGPTKNSDGVYLPATIISLESP